MFPVNQSGEEPPFTMGGDGERVNIWQWKATWNNEGKTSDSMADMEDQYAYMAMGSGSTTCMSLMGSYLVSVLVAKDQVVLSRLLVEPFPKLVREQVTSASVLPTLTLEWVRTKVSSIRVVQQATSFRMLRMRVSAVEDLNAEGFSTLTTQAQQDVDGEGNWRNNRWAVVFKRALKTGDANDTQFNGGKTPMAIAIWDGNNKERNGQKAVTQWNTLHY